MRESLGLLLFMQQVVSFYNFNLTGMSYQLRNFLMCLTIKIVQNGKKMFFFVSVSAFNVCWNKDCCFYLYYKFLFLEQEYK